ncbi:MAG: metallophosphoesterase [Pseudomonadota bacterium]
MRIAQISDTHILTPDSDQAASPIRADNLRRCVAEINRQSPDIVIHTGDMVQNGDPREYAYLRSILAPLKAPLCVVPGNRDEKAAARAAFADLGLFPATGEFLHYSLEDYPVRLVGLDSVGPNERKGHFCRKRQIWLEETLAQAPEKPTVLFIHHPPFDVGDHYVGGYRHGEEAMALAEVVARHPQVIRLLCGHVHWPIEQSWAGTTATIMPSVAVDVRKGVDEVQAQGRPLCYLHDYAIETGLVSRFQMVGD